MNCKQIASSLFALIILTFISISFSQQSVSADYNLTPTTTLPHFPPTESFQQRLQEKMRAEFETEQMSFEFDFTCSIPCWSRFKPSILFRDVKSAQENSNHDVEIKKNAVEGIQQTVLGLLAFSDATQPEPLLRAYMIRVSVGMPSYAGGHFYTLADPSAVFPKSVIDLFPDIRLNTVPPPTVLFGRIDYDERFYSIIYEYENWALHYLYEMPYAPHFSNEPHCSQEELYAIVIWVYSDSEAGFQPFWSDLQQNYYFPESITLRARGGKLPPIAFQTLDIQAFKEARREGTCLPLDSQ